MSQQEAEVAVNLAVNSDDELAALHDLLDQIVKNKKISNIAKALICEKVIEVTNQAAKGLGFSLNHSLGQYPRH